MRYDLHQDGGPSARPGAPPLCIPSPRPEPAGHADAIAMATLPDAQELQALIMKSTAAARSAMASGDTSPIRSSASSTRSIEESGPPTPVHGPPQNFDAVAPGLYRSSFPRLSNLDYLRPLGLKTILTLVDGPYPPEFRAFLQQQSIQHYAIPFPAHKDPSDAVPVETMLRALAVLQDAAQQPVLVHCNKGKHRTGCAIACYRLVTGGRLEDVLDEYRTYAGAKARLLDEHYIRNFADGLSKCPHRQRAPSSGSAAYPTPPPSEKGASGGAR